MASREPASTKCDPTSDRSTSVARRPETGDALSGLQQAVGNQAVTQMFGAQKVQTKLRIGALGDRFEQEADRVAKAVVSGPSTEAASVQGGSASVGIQRACAECAEEETLRRAPMEGETASNEATGAPTESEQAIETPETPPEPAVTSAPAVLVDDDAETVQAGQMRKSDFLAALRESVCAAANGGLASAGQTTTDCPWVEYWFDYASGKDAAYVEKAIRKYAPEGAGASTAQELIPIVTARVRQSVDTWVKSGEISGVPEGFGDAAAAGTAFGGVFFKARPGGPGHVSSPEAIRDRLGGGRPLPVGVRSRMESVFGSSFSGVRIHTDSTAAGLSESLNARAFTIGQHVAFGAGEYRPGSLVGDALLAHELAHVVQQGGATAGAAPMGKDAGQEAALEDDADRAAVSAVASGLTAAGPSSNNAARGAFPRLRSGLGLSRCSKSGQPKKTVTVNVTFLSGGSTDLATHLTKTNLVYKQADVEVVAGTQKTLDETKSKAILGADLILDEFSDPSTPTAEETALIKENRGAAVTMYYVKGMSQGSLGEAFVPSLGHAPSFVYASSNPRTWPHELGHVLLDDTSHPSDADNFMAQTSVASGKELMTQTQIDTIRKNI